VAKRKKGRKQHERKRDIKCVYWLTRGGSNREQASPTLCVHKNGGTIGDDNGEGLRWLPPELALLFILPEHQSTIIPPFLCKARGQKQEGKKEMSNVVTGSQGEAQIENKLPKHHAFVKRGVL